MKHKYYFLKNMFTNTHIYMSNETHIDELNIHVYSNFSWFKKLIRPD